MNPRPKELRRTPYFGQHAGHVIPGRRVMPIPGADARRLSHLRFGLCLSCGLPNCHIPKPTCCSPRTGQYLGFQRLIEYFRLPKTIQSRGRPIPASRNADSSSPRPAQHDASRPSIATAGTTFMPNLSARSATSASFISRTSTSQESHAIRFTNCSACSHSGQPALNTSILRLTAISPTFRIPFDVRLYLPDSSFYTLQGSKFPRARS